MLFLNLFLLIIGFIILIKGADFLVDGSSSLAKSLNVSNIAIGLTVVAFGTSTPEMVVNIFASVGNNNDIVFGNIIGSNIFNVLLIIGVCGLIRPLSILKNTAKKEIPFAIFGALLLLLLVNDNSVFKTSDILSRFDGFILMFFFSLFVFYVFKISKLSNENDSLKIKALTLKKSIVFVILGLLALILGGKLVIETSVNICRAFSISEKLISLTVISIGTSLPELFTSVVATKKGHDDIAVGNIIGSCIFNIFAILGVSALISPAPYSVVLNFDIYVMIFSSILLFVYMYTGSNKKVDRWQALLFLLFYVAYVAYIYFRN